MFTQDAELEKKFIDFADIMLNVVPLFGKNEDQNIQYACAVSVLFELNHRRLSMPHPTIIEEAKKVFAYFNTYFCEEVCVIATSMFEIQFSDMIEHEVRTTPRFK